MYFNDDGPWPQGIAFPRSIGNSIFVTQTIVPYWSIVLPFTLLSAFLLLSKPRPAKPAEPPITTAN